MNSTLSWIASLQLFHHWTRAFLFWVSYGRQNWIWCCWLSPHPLWCYCCCCFVAPRHRNYGVICVILLSLLWFEITVSVGKVEAAEGSWTTIWVSFGLCSLSMGRGAAAFYCLAWNHNWKCIWWSGGWVHRSTCVSSHVSSTGLEFDLTYGFRWIWASLLFYPDAFWVVVVGAGITLLPSWTSHCCLFSNCFHFWWR